MIELHVYTDASGNKKTADFGYSAVFLHNNKKYFQSFSISKNEIQFILDISEEVSNPTIEVFAFVEFLSSFRSELISSKKYTGMNITVYSDYKGVPAWFNDEWIINKPYIQKLVNQSKKYANDLLTSYDISISVKWVKGHSGIEGNEEADKLAGQRLNESNFNEFFKSI